MRNYRYTLSTLLLFVFLVVPFILRLKDNRLEPYPVFLLPSGPSLVCIDEKNIEASIYRIYGCKNSALVELDRKEFFKDIPPQFFHGIREAHFGLEEFHKEFKLYKPPIKFHYRNYFTPKSLKETKEWFCKKLKENGIDDSYFVIRTYDVIISMDSKEEISRKLTYEKFFLLD